jgi:hypothetical protein
MIVVCLPAHIKAVQFSPERLHLAHVRLCDAGSICLGAAPPVGLDPRPEPINGPALPTELRLALSYMLQSTVLMTAAPSSPDPAADNPTVAPAPAQVGWRSSRALDSMCAL